MGTFLSPKLYARFKIKEKKQQWCGYAKGKIIADAGNRKQNYGKNPCVFDRHLAGGNGTVAFCGVITVFFLVTDIVDDIHNRRKQAKKQKQLKQKTAFQY